jgi:hypothetical protein
MTLTKSIYNKHYSSIIYKIADINDTMIILLTKLLNKNS